ncbi:hypothetical protein PV08_11323 [Exophiala spinifera]|uniref:Uncharacterized protein n=1 Tax=Exophiala spinifera TaxID=91928 RepID=A0A0D1Y637_9EURO|nr:uncharacterized protein PV08_11323 [Exophiala spinifera]KIW10361.1 hypothetical protein PV08_11323 [Exophiala spinifera]
MWRSRNNAPQIGYDAWAEPTMEERCLETIPEVESLYSQYSRRSSVAATNLPDLPFRAVPSINEYDPVQPRDSAVTPTTSEPYTQDIPSQNPHRSRSPVDSDNVSPISALDSLHQNGSEGSLVSPVDSGFPVSTSASQPEATTKSKIPRKMPLSAPKNNNEIPKRWALKKSEGEETRWDEYSGEPNQAGKPPSARPGSIPPTIQQYPQLKERTRQILAGIKERDAVTKSGWGKVPPPVDPDPLDNPVQRPAWRGASGRHAIVEPVKNTPAARPKPLMLVERKRLAEAEQRPRADVPDSFAPETTPKSPIDAVSVAASKLPAIRSIPSEDSIKPVAPLKVKNTLRVMSPIAAEPKALDSPFRSPGVASPMYEPATSPSPTPSTVRSYGDESPTLGSNASYTGERSSSEDSVETTMQAQRLQREHDTSSSWNTYTDGGSPNPNSRAEMTSSPVSMTGPYDDMPSPIYLRKRAAANNGGRRGYDSYNSVSPFSNVAAQRSSSNILRKAIGSQPKPRAISLMSGLSATKSLPPTPVELEATDKLASLEARLEDLGRRKRNQRKIIAELHESLRRNAIVYDSRKRREVEKMITNLNLEVQEITNEEHETSLKLHRVVKRRDREEYYEQPTGLWIKRVTT